MDLVQVKIEKDDNTISYIKIIHEFDKTISISEINAGAKLQILLNGEIESMQLLDNWIHSIKDNGLTEFYKIT